jgi:tape measure domain-containing protein
MKSLALAFSQATASGKLMGQDLNQMINAGFNPLEVISRKTGKSIDQLKEEMEAGGISAKELGEAFQMATQEGERFYKGAERAGSTTAGRLEKKKEKC